MCIFYVYAYPCLEYRMLNVHLHLYVSVSLHTMVWHIEDTHHRHEKLVHLLPAGVWQAMPNYLNHLVTDAILGSVHKTIVTTSPVFLQHYPSIKEYLEHRVSNLL